MATPTRIYRYQNRLIRASRPEQAKAFIAKDLPDPKVASQDDLEELFGKGVKGELARVVQAELSAEPAGEPAAAAAT